MIDAAVGKKEEPVEFPPAEKNSICFSDVSSWAIPRSRTTEESPWNDNKPFFLAESYFIESISGENFCWKYHTSTKLIYFNFSNHDKQRERERKKQPFTQVCALFRL